MYKTRLKIISTKGIIKKGHEETDEITKVWIKQLESEEHRFATKPQVGMIVRPEYFMDSAMGYAQYYKALNEDFRFRIVEVELESDLILWVEPATLPS